jgi:hypothetical protein
MYAALLTAVVTWIAANFDLPRDFDHPQVKLVPAVEITLLRYQAFTPAQRRDVPSSPGEIAAGTQRREPVAVYDDRTKTVFLPDTWTGATPADLSVLVHEMVHHLQNSAHMKYDHPGARTAGVCRTRQMAQAVRSRPRIRVRHRRLHAQGDDHLRILTGGALHCALSVNEPRPRTLVRFPHAHCARYHRLCTVRARRSSRQPGAFGRRTRCGAALHAP